MDLRDWVMTHRKYNHIVDPDPNMVNFNLTSGVAVNWKDETYELKKKDWKD